MANPSTACGPQGCVPEVQEFQIIPSKETAFRLRGVTPDFGRWEAMVRLATDALTGEDAVTNAERIRQALSVAAPARRLAEIQVSGSGLPGAVQTFSVSFRGVAGDLPPVRIARWRGPGGVVDDAITLTTEQNGTATPQECSGRGVCDPSAGLCQCGERFSGAACELVLERFGLNDGALSITKKQSADDQSTKDQALAWVEGRTV